MSGREVTGWQISIPVSGDRGCLEEGRLGVQGQVWEFRFRLFLHFLGKIAVQEMSGKTPGSPRHPSSRHPRPSEKSSSMELYKPWISGPLRVSWNFGLNRSLLVHLGPPTVLCYLEVPRVRLSISGVKSGTNPETLRKRSQSNSEFPGFVRLEIPKHWKIKEIPSPD